jgi:dolichol-phosphate mannosyltransferase
MREHQNAEGSQAPLLVADLTVVVPCFNEAPNVAPLIARLDTALAGIAWEVVFVDDNSPDGTAEQAKQLAQRDPRIRCLRRIGRRGLASACVEGILSSSASYVAVIDGDLQHDETILPRMLESVRGGTSDIAIGSRHVDGGGIGQGLSAHRAKVSDLGSWLSKHLLSVPVSDPMSGFFLLPRALFDDIAPKLSGRGFKILLDILLSSPRALRIVEVPYVFRQRTAGCSKLNIVVMLEFALLLMDKLLGGLLPRRFIAFAGVGLIGVVLNMAVLFTLFSWGGVGFDTAQWIGTMAAMLVNFHLNNSLTYRDVRLKGLAMVRGLASFMLVCGIGAVANVGVANLLIEQHTGWFLAGAAGSVITAVWNYAMASTLVWRRTK